MKRKATKCKDCSEEIEPMLQSPMKELCLGCYLSHKAHIEINNEEQAERTEWVEADRKRGRTRAGEGGEPGHKDD